MWYLLFGVVAVVAASGNSGPCPSVQSVAGLDIAAFSGLWYEWSKYPAPAEGNGVCTTTEYTVDGDVIKVKNTNVRSGVLNTIIGTAKVQNGGDMVVDLKVGDVILTDTLQILATDYKNWAILYTCKADAATNTHRKTSWVLSRTKSLEGEAKAAVDNYIASNEELDASKYEQNDFSDEACKFTSTISRSN